MLFLLVHKENLPQIELLRLLASLPIVFPPFPGFGFCAPLSAFLCEKMKAKKLCISAKLERHKLPLKC